MINKEKLKEAIEFAQEQDISEIEVDGIKLKVPPKPMPIEEGKELISEYNPFPEYTDEEIIFWATPYFDELQEKKRQQQEAAKETQDLRG
jgi:hypothetical protein